MSRRQRGLGIRGSRLNRLVMIQNDVAARFEPRRQIVDADQLINDRPFRPEPKNRCLFLYARQFHR